MSELPRLSTHNRRPSQTVRYAAAAGVLVLAGINSNSCSTGGDVVVRIPTIITKQPGTPLPLSLECTDNYEETTDGRTVPINGLAYPRAIVFDSNTGTIFGANIQVEYGERYYTIHGDEDEKRTHVTTHDYWVAEDNQDGPGETGRSRFASGNGSLPSDSAWEDDLQYPTQFGGDGTELPNISINPEGNGSQVVVARISPYFEHDFGGETEPVTIYSSGSFAVECRPAIANIPAPSAGDISDDTLTVHVPHSTTETNPPAQS